MPWAGFLVLNHARTQSQQKNLASGKFRLTFVSWLLNELLLSWQYSQDSGLRAKRPCFQKLWWGGSLFRCPHWNHRENDPGNSSNLLLLSNTVSPSLSLKIILGVPVRVKDNNSISRGQIDSQPTSSCWQQETEVLRKRKKSIRELASL